MRDAPDEDGFRVTRFSASALARVSSLFAGDLWGGRHGEHAQFERWAYTNVNDDLSRNFYDGMGVRLRGEI